ncbi:hypothetical protein [Mumia zhuanghuii]|uniref:Uncharacterized protein n=1 Tax=Mumia zhuanghuii TaxID=2585211 RepID=A0A5C4MT82_9ACTN|nr:hypothetical protein [Mumia zhuanghuii]TNC47536.1 hypothetical protein FHE65_09480 [Mumia zhuanghuii]TNC50290.1 hypothetical protein FHE65_04280 [Mumia zhuanghuii]
MSYLNDRRGFTRRKCFFEAAAVGSWLGALTTWPLHGGDGRLLAGFATIGIAVLAVSTFISVVGTRWIDRRLKAVIEQGSEEILAGAVVGTPAPGQIVRRYSANGRRAYAMGFPVAADTPADALLLTALLPDGARRVAALVPRPFGRAVPGATACLIVHPDRADVAVLDARAAPEDLAAVTADPRWRSADLPTDTSVFGSPRMAVRWTVAGLAGGATLGWFAMVMFG